MCVVHLVIGNWTLQVSESNGSIGYLHLGDSSQFLHFVFNEMNGTKIVWSVKQMEKKKQLEKPCVSKYDAVHLMGSL